MSHHGKTKAQKGSLPAMTVTPVAAAIGVVLRDDQVLLVRRANQPDAGKCGFPGGKIEPGEPVQAAAAREVAEETGVVVRPLHVFTAVDAFHRSEWTVGHPLCVDRRIMRVDFRPPAGGR